MRRHSHRRSLFVLLLVLLAAAPLWPSAPGGPAVVRAAGPALANPILFVTHVPTPFDVLTTVTTFGNHLGDVHAAGRGGDLWLRLADGTLVNLTQRAGLGSTDPGGFQGASSIAVRDPSVSWDGTKALFSMAVGAPTQAGGAPPAAFWQIYELTNLGQIVQDPSAAPVIVKLANQPQGYNNITPLYGTNGRIIFTSDRPRTGEAHLYPLLDEYNMRPTVTGLWSMDPATGGLFLMDHSPSGDLTPGIDSFGRVVFVRWDHLERDQQADADALAAIQNPQQPCNFCTFNYADESAQAARLSSNAEYFPEPRPQRTDLLAGTNQAGHHMNEFLPWQIGEDGSAPETLNHIGRHELLAHIPPAFTDDPNLRPLNGAPPGAFNPSRILKFIQLREDAAHPGDFYGADVLELTHGSGQLLKLTGGAPGSDADHMAITYITHRETISTTTSLPLPHSDGHYRDPLPMSDGTLVAVYTPVKDFEAPVPNQPAAPSKFSFRLYTLGPDAANPGYMAHSQPLTSGLPTKTLSYYDGPTLITRTNIQLWELQPVEVRARQLPPAPAAAGLPAPEQAAFAAAGVTPAQLQSFLAQNNLALIVSRNVTARDHSDLQQPFRLQVGSSGAATAPGGGKLYRIDNLQLLQADQLRGMTGKGSSTPVPGRRVLAQPLHDPAALQYNPPAAQPGSVALGQDGSMAAFVPARRAVTWQLTSDIGAPVVRERFWLTAQPGEIRVCASCHGLNQSDQAGRPVPTNTPQALTQLLQYWKQLNDHTPAVSALAPAQAPAGGAAFTLTVSGGNFASDAQVQWNGTPVPTTFVSASQLTASIPASLLATAGSASVSVLNPGAGAQSGALTFAITGPSTLQPRAFLPWVKR
jgi:hypothetical protein